MIKRFAVVCATAAVCVIAITANAAGQSGVVGVPMPTEQQEHVPGPGQGIPTQQPDYTPPAITPIVPLQPTPEPVIGEGVWFGPRVWLPMIAN